MPGGRSVLIFLSFKKNSIMGAFLIQLMIKELLKDFFIIPKVKKFPLGNVLFLKKNQITIFLYVFQLSAI